MHPRQYATSVIFWSQLIPLGRSFPSFTLYRHRPPGGNDPICDMEIVSVRHHVSDSPLPPRFIVHMMSGEAGDVLALESPAHSNRPAGPPPLLPVYLGPELSSPSQLFYYPQTPAEFIHRYCSPLLLSSRLLAGPSAVTLSPFPSSRSSTNLTLAVAKRFLSYFPDGVEIKVDRDILDGLQKDLTTLEEQHSDAAKPLSPGYGTFIADQTQTYTEMHKIHEVEEIFTENDQTGALRCGPLAMANATMNYLFSSMGRIMWSHASKEENVQSDLQTWDESSGTTWISKTKKPRPFTSARAGDSSQGNPVGSEGEAEGPAPKRMKLALPHNPE